LADSLKGQYQFLGDKAQGMFTGLGLAITKSLLEKNHGKLSIESKENAYTKVIILLK
jgi:signal transduction histidine kinase